jgi:hypothetical protein
MLSTLLLLALLSTYSDLVWFVKATPPLGIGTENADAAELSCELLFLSTIVLESVISAEEAPFLFALPEDWLAGGLSADVVLEAEDCCVAMF